MNPTHMTIFLESIVWGLAKPAPRAFPDSAKAYPGQSSPAMYAARRSSAALE
jgi:hypothetical protein